MIRILEIARKIVALGSALAVMLFLPGLILVSIVDITGRRFLHYSSTPLQELAWHFFFATVMFAIGHVYIVDRHVRVDVIRERLPTRWKIRLERFFLLIFLLPLCLVLFWFGVRLSWLSFVQDETSTAALGLSTRWIVKATLPIGALLLFFAGCYRFAHPVQPERDEL